MCLTCCERCHRKCFNANGLRNPHGGLAGPAPSMHGADKDAQSQNANVISHLISELCAIHIGPPPDQHQTATGPLPDTDATDLHEAGDGRLTSAGSLPSVPIGAIRVSSDRRLTNARPLLLHSSFCLLHSCGQPGRLTGDSPDTHGSLTGDNFEARGAASSLRQTS